MNLFAAAATTISQISGCDSDFAKLANDELWHLKGAVKKSMEDRFKFGYRDPELIMVYHVVGGKPFNMPAYFSVYSGYHENGYTAKEMKVKYPEAYQTEVQPLLALAREVDAVIEPQWKIKEWRYDGKSRLDEFRRL